MIQCKNCKFGLKDSTHTYCIGWINGKNVNNNKQRACSRFCKKRKEEIIEVIENERIIDLIKERDAKDDGVRYTLAEVKEMFKCEEKVNV